MTSRVGKSGSADDAPLSKPAEEWLTPFSKPREQIADAVHFRSTWLTASQATIRARGLASKYEAELDPKHREAVLFAIAGVWIPMEVAIAHYSACDRLGFTDAELLEIGRAAMLRANTTTLSMVTHLARGVGATPWTVLQHTHRFWASSCDGGELAVARLGPKEARIEVIGYPLAALRYNRITLRGIVLGCVQLFCKTAFVKDIPALCTARTIGFRVSWA